MNTTANKITIFRVLMIPVFLVLAYTGHRYWALAVFVLASLSDMLDGYIARHYNQVTNFGKFMDPLADKVLVMRNGETVEYGETRQVLEDPKEEYTKLLMSAVPRLRRV